MSSPDLPQKQDDVPFNPSVDNELLTVVLATEVYLIPFERARAAFDMIRNRMIMEKAFTCDRTEQQNVPIMDSPPSSSQLLERFKHLVSNHPCRELPDAQQPSIQLQLNKRSRLLDQVFYGIINSVYTRGVGRPPRKYIFNDALDIILLEQVLQHKAHLLPRPSLMNKLSLIRKNIIVKYGFTSDHIVPAPSTIMEGAPTVPQLAVRYQHLIMSHINPENAGKTEPNREPEAAHKLGHLLDVIVRAIVNKALSGSELLRKGRRLSLEKQENELDQPVLPGLKKRKSLPNMTHVKPGVRKSSERRHVITSNKRPNLGRHNVNFGGNGEITVGKPMELQSRPALTLAKSEDMIAWQKKMEERRLALEEEQLEQNRKLTALQEQRVKLQEKALGMVQEEHKTIMSSLSSIVNVLSAFAEKLGMADPNTTSDADKNHAAGVVQLDNGPVLVDATISIEKPDKKDEVPMDVEPSLKETSSNANGQPEEGKAPVESKPAMKADPLEKGQANPNNESQKLNEDSPKQENT